MRLRLSKWRRSTVTTVCSCDRNSSRTLTGVTIDLGDGIFDGARLGVTSPNGTATSLMVTGSVKSRGGSFKLFAGSEAGSSLLTVDGDLTEIGGPGDDSLGIETEFPGGTVLVNGDMRVIAGEGDDCIEFNANGTITVDGRYTAFGQTGEDCVWLGGQTGAIVNGQSRLFGGPGHDELDLYNFTYDTISIKQVETCIDCP